MLRHLFIGVLLAFACLFWNVQLLYGITWTVFLLNCVSRNYITTTPTPLSQLTQWLFDVSARNTYYARDPQMSIPPQRLREMTASEYLSHPETVRAISEDYRFPFAIRGLFNVSTITPKFLVSTLADLSPVKYEKPTTTDFGNKFKYGPKKRPNFAEIVQNFTNGGDMYVFGAFMYERYRIIVDRIGWKKAVRRDTGLFSFFGVSPDYFNPIAWVMFCGNSKGFSDWHAAEPPNLAIQMVGSKRWRFIAPFHSVLLQPAMDKGISFSHAGNVNVNFIPRFEVFTEPGDVLFVPSWWWHEVKNMDLKEDEEDFNFLMGVRPLFHKTHAMSQNWVSTLASELAGSHEHEDWGWHIPPFVTSVTMFSMEYLAKYTPLDMNVIVAKLLPFLAL